MKTNRLMQLMALNRSAERSYRVEAKADEATIYLYDVIGYDYWTGGGITAKQFAKDLQAINAPTVHLRFNSPGGDVFEGRAIVTAIQQFKGKVVAHIDGLAASAASFIAMHADEIEMTEGAFLMIHNGWTIAVGDRHVFLDTAALLEKVDASIVEDYRAKTGRDPAELAEMMNAETWINAQDAVALGFADRVAVSAKDAKAQAKWNLAAYENTPEGLAIANSAMPDLNDAERGFCAAMIEHHQMALDMADAVYPEVEAPEIKALADGIISAQAGEIALLQRWVGDSASTAEAKKKKPMKMQANSADHEHRERRFALVAGTRQA